MSDLDVLRELVGGFRPPRYDDLVAVSRKRRRRSALGAGAALSALVAVVTMAVAALPDGQSALEPADPTRTASQSPQWTPERVRAEGAPVSMQGGGPSGLKTQLYCIGRPVPTGSPCDSYHPYDPAEDAHWALELTHRGRSVLFDVQGTPLAQDFDEDSILVQDGPDNAPRFRLLQTDGTEVLLRRVSETAPAVPGPSVRLIGTLAVQRRGSFGPDGPGERPYVVDEVAGTLRPLDVPEEIEWWGPNVDEFLWGGSGCRVIWQQPDGRFDRHDPADCNSGTEHTDPGWNGWDAFADWLKPGRMALVEWNVGGAAVVVHGSVDRGATWERIAVETPDRDSVEQTANVIRGALRQLG